MFAMNAISSLSLVHRFLLVGFCVLVAAMVFIGTWVGTQIQSGIMNGMGVMTDLYLDGAISPHLQSLANGRDSKQPTGSHLTENWRARISASKSSR